MTAGATIPAAVPAPPATPPATVAMRLRERWNATEPLVGAPIAEWPPLLRRIRRVGLALLGLQFLGLCVWSSVLVHRDSLTSDFTTYEQALYLIAHGHLDPFSSALGYSFWQDHGSFLLWPAALLQWLWPHPVTLLWLQDAAGVGAELVAFIWVCELASHRVARGGAVGPASACAAVTLLLLLINPWIYWTLSDDFHTEPLATVFLVATARDLYAGRRRVWLWLVLTLLMGDVGASCCLALGVSAIASGRRWLRPGLGVAVAGLAWMVALGGFQATRGTVPSYYAPLLLGHMGHVPATTSALTIAGAIVLHPGRALAALWSNHLNLWANLAAIGLLGLIWSPVTVPLVLILVEGALAHGTRTAVPGFQNLPILILGIVGTLAVCLNMSRAGARRRLLPAVLVLLTVNALGWAIVWLPRISATWLRVSPAAAATLHQLAGRIGPGDQVYVEQGIAGLFAERQWVRPIFKTPLSVRVHARHIWFVLAPTQGIETVRPVSADRLIAAVGQLPDVRLVVRASGVWAFEWTPGHVHALTVRTPSAAALPAWTVPGPAGSLVFGRADSWHLRGGSRPGYTLAEDYWTVPAGRVTATVALAVSGRANVELWDDSSGRLLDRVVPSSSDGRQVVRLQAEVERTPTEGAYAGWGPWRIRPAQPPSGHVIEVRVWSPGTRTAVSVWSVTVHAAHAM